MICPLRLEDQLTIMTHKTNVEVYDFDFELFFQCSHPYHWEDQHLCVLRTGAISDYQNRYDEYLLKGLRLINSPEQHVLASELPAWYSYVQEFTPRSVCFESFPPLEEISDIFSFPIFIKGARQTSQHNPELSIIHTPADYADISQHYQNDPILHWQKIVLREFIDLAPAPGNVPGKIQPSLEFRSFWWNGHCVGWGQYWYQLPPYSTEGIDEGLSIAQEAASRLKVPFLVIDIAKTIDGQWIIIECNDAQESGYSSISPQVLWRNILDQV